jgi:hypothetical protein
VVGIDRDSFGGIMRYIATALLLVLLCAASAQGLPFIEEGCRYGIVGDIATNTILGDQEGRIQVLEVEGKWIRARVSGRNEAWLNTDAFIAITLLDDQVTRACLSEVAIQMEIYMIDYSRYTDHETASAEYGDIAICEDITLTSEDLEDTYRVVGEYGCSSMVVTPEERIQQLKD